MDTARCRTAEKTSSVFDHMPEAVSAVETFPRPESSISSILASVCTRTDVRFSTKMEGLKSVCHCRAHKSACHRRDLAAKTDSCAFPKALAPGKGYGHSDCIYIEIFQNEPTQVFES